MSKWGIKKVVMLPGLLGLSMARVVFFYVETNTKTKSIAELDQMWCESRLPEGIKYLRQEYGRILQKEST